MCRETGAGPTASDAGGQGAEGAVVALPLALPTGTVTFLLTDLEGSTISWQRHPGEMPGAVVRLGVLLDDAIVRWSGVRPIEQGEGDSVVAAFAKATDALAAALAIQLAVQHEVWPGSLDLRMRIGIHTGRRSPAMRATLSGRRSSGRPGSVTPATAGRSWCRRVALQSRSTCCRTALRWSTSGPTV
jgi:hypothetical protein